MLALLLYDYTRTEHVQSKGNFGNLFGKVGVGASSACNVNNVRDNDSV